MNGAAKILIVDDLIDNLVALEALLRREDVEILSATSGRGALELLLSHDVALAIVDVQMPEMDGFELAELMRGAERTRRVPIIFVTAGLRDQSRVFDGYDAGAVDFLFKPVDARILRHKVDVFLQLDRQRRVMAETLRLSEELMAVVGHDLRDPLGVIGLCAEIIATTHLDPRAKGALERLRLSAGRIQQILNEVLDLSRARLGGGIPVERGSIDILPVAKKIVGELQTIHPTRTIEVRSYGDTHGEWDGGRLEQVFSNLVGNALRHGEPAEPVVVAVDALAPAEVIVSVHNGGDIPRDLMPRLFEPFHSSKEHRPRADGLGLGLYIVKQIAHAHGGTIDVRSGEGDGTTFQVRLPRGAQVGRAPLGP